MSPSEEDNLSDGIVVVCDDYNNGVIDGVLSRFNNSAMFINVFFVELCAPGKKSGCSLCNK